MTESNKSPGEKKLSVAPTKTLTLKRSGVEQGMVRQSFSHGRTKAVVVEKVKRRVPGEAKSDAAPAAAPAPMSTPTTVPAGRRAAAQATAPAASPAAGGVAASKPSGVVLRTLTEEERSARAHALADAKVREAEERKVAEDEARRRNERETRERV
jgi:translation initiation factor IF-2